jgi:glycosyltransferase involved in cell wall biosynthesis
MAGRPFLERSNKVIVADLYDPLHLEQLEQARDESEVRRREIVGAATAVLNQQLGRGDFFLCASEKQRDFWLGQMAGIGRLNPKTYDEDESLRALLAVVPFGVTDEPPHRTGPGLRGVMPGVEAGDEVILWGGGVYNWFDPITLLRAVDALRAARPAVRLVFMGMRHPNAEIARMSMEDQTRKLAAELGLVGTHVFFNEDWVPYDDRQNVLLDADVGVSTHLDHLETAFSFRTRVLDYFWASLPVVVTAGDALADLVERRGLGIAVPPQDVEALAAALDLVLSDGEFAARCRANIASVVPELRWSEAVRPLVEFCRNPRRAPDLIDPATAATLATGRVALPAQRGWRHDIGLVREHLRVGGPRLLGRRIASRSRRVLGRGGRGPEPMR